jgi:predicted acylesterase/phospholipase RssA
VGIDLVLSSGFLAFARQAGFLSAVEAAGLEVDAVCGTSSGALAGAMWVAGLPASSIATHLSEKMPLRSMRPHLRPWRGALSMRGVIAQLRAWLPPRFEDLPRPFAVGVRAPDGSAQLIRSGPLPEAVAASCAIPGVFAPVMVGGVPYQDGGVVDRTGLGAWSAVRGRRPTLVHLVQATSQGLEPSLGLPPEVRIVRTPRSGARFWDLGDFAGQQEEARRLTTAVLNGWTR